MAVARILEAVLGPGLPIAVRAHDWSRLGPADATATLLVRSPNVFRRLVTAPGELGLGRAYVTGELDVQADLYAALAAPRSDPRRPRVRPQAVGRRARARRLLPRALRPEAAPRPAEEARLRGVRDTKERDAAAIAHHYDVSNAFYRIVLGPSMTYSCAVWERPDVTVEQAQGAKYGFVCRKLGLGSGMRLLTWAAAEAGWSCTRRPPRRAGGRRDALAPPGRVGRQGGRRAGLAERVHIRYQDHRDVADGPFDVISSIGMFEHVGCRSSGLRRAASAAPPGGPAAEPRGSPARRTPAARASGGGASSTATSSPTASRTRAAPWSRRSSEHVWRSATSRAWREHYALTLRAWVRNLEAS